jgi:signal transduction histidine kinase
MRTAVQPAMMHRLDSHRGRRRHPTTRARESVLGGRDVSLRTLAHDLKTPLTSLSWQVQLLARRLREGQLDPVTLDAGLKAIASGAAEAVSGIDELHNLARVLAAAPTSLPIEAVDLVSHVRDRLARRPHAAAHVLLVESAEETLVVKSDRARLGRVFDNLLDNAIKYSPPGSQIRVVLDRTQEPGESWASLSVQDHGVGIPAGDLPWVFDLYHRGSNVACTPGDGLGLASVRRLVESLGGRIEVESQEGVGSTFTVHLPLTCVGA